MSDYDERAKEYGFASKESIAKALKEPKTVLLDVRRQDEIDENGAFKIKNHPWVQSSCTPTECPDLEARANELLPDKDGKFGVLSGQVLVHKSSLSHGTVVTRLQPPLSSIADLEEEPQGQKKLLKTWDIRLS